MQVANSLLSALHWSAGQFSQPVKGFRACPAGHGSAKKLNSYFGYQQMLEMERAVFKTSDTLARDSLSNVNMP